MNDTAWQLYEGSYDMAGTTITVRVINRQLTIRFPGVPPGFEITLIYAKIEGPPAFIQVIQNNFQKRQAQQKA